jgi:hypothetical protein
MKRPLSTVSECSVCGSFSHEFLERENRRSPMAAYSILEVWYMKISQYGGATKMVMAPRNFRLDAECGNSDLDRTLLHKILFRSAILSMLWILHMPPWTQNGLFYPNVLQVVCNYFLFSPPLASLCGVSNRLDAIVALVIAGCRRYSAHPMLLSNADGLHNESMAWVINGVKAQSFY